MPVPVLVAAAVLLELLSRFPLRTVAGLVVAVGLIGWFTIARRDPPTEAIRPLHTNSTQTETAASPPSQEGIEPDQRPVGGDEAAASKDHHNITAGNESDSEETVEPPEGKRPVKSLVSTRKAAEELQRWIDVKLQPSEVVMAWQDVEDGFVHGQWTLEPGQHIGRTDAVVAGTRDNRLLAYAQSFVIRPHHVVKLVDVAQRRRGVVALDDWAATELQFSPCGRWLVVREMALAGWVVISSDGALVEPLASHVLRVIRTDTLEQKALLVGPVKTTSHITSRRTVIGADTYRFTPDGDRIVVAFDNVVRVWKLGQEPVQLEAELTAGDEITSLEFDATRELLVAREKLHGVDRWRTDTWRHVGRVAGEWETEEGKAAAVKRIWRSPVPSRFAEAVSADGARYVSLEKIFIDGHDAMSLTFYDGRTDRFDVVDMMPPPERWLEIGDLSYCGNERLVARGSLGQPVVLDLPSRTAYAIGPREYPSHVGQIVDGKVSTATRGRPVVAKKDGKLETLAVVGDDLAWGLREDGRVELWNVSMALEYAKTKEQMDVKLQSDWREWTDERGRKLTARLVGVRDGDVELHVKGERNRFVPWVKLSQPDRIHVLWAVYEGGELRDWKLPDGGSLRASLVGVENRRVKLRRESGQTLLADIADREWDYVRRNGEWMIGRLARQFEKLRDNDERLLAQIAHERQGLQGVWKAVSGLPEGQAEEDGLFYFVGNRLAKPFYFPHQDMQWNWRRLWHVPRRKTKAMLNYEGDKQIGAWIYERNGDRLRLEFCVPPGVPTDFGRNAMELVRVRNTVNLDEIGVPIDDSAERSSQP